MKKMSICLELASDRNRLSDIQAIENNYQKIFKKLLSFLYAHPKFYFSFSFNGIQLSYYASKHPEAIKLLSELTSRHQVEILGGGYFDPIFPLIFPVDRSGQIEKLTSELRATVGKRPRGISLFESIWDPSLVTTFQTCGMEYVQLDNTLIPKERNNYLPLITSEQGKSIKILSVNNELKPFKEEEISDWFVRIKKIFDKQDKNQINSGITVLEFTFEEIAKLLEDGSFDFINNLCISEKNNFDFTIPTNYLKSASYFIPSYIPAGMDWKIAQWAQKPYTCTENKSRFPVTVYDFLNSYTLSHKLYERMMYISILISQAHGDKMRKSSAREKLWEAQTGYAYVCSPEGIPAAAKLRQKAYKLLNEAEKIIKECCDEKESITSYDYNGDGINEYICQMNKFNAVISKDSGSIVELDILQNGGNYADSLNRMELFDKVDDNYHRGLFVEHLFEKTDKDKYIKQIPSGNGIFSQVRFTEKKLDILRNDIQLEGRGEFSSLQQPVSLRKNYIVTSNGCSIQYILKNESPLSLKGFLVVESNFAQTSFTDTEITQYDAEIVSKGEKLKLNCNERYSTEDGVSILQVNDCANNISFVFEPNEESGFTTALITFKRPSKNGKLINASNTVTTGLYWAIDLAAGMEMEKTINFTIIPSKKNKKK